MSNIIKFKYDDIKITIRTRYNNYYLDFIHDGKRIKRSTGLSANENNLKDLKINVIPEIIKALTGSNEIEYLKEDIAFVDFSDKFFETYKSTVRVHVYHQNLLIYKKQIKPHFQYFLLKDIKPIHLENWQIKLLEKCASSTVKGYRSIFNSILEKATSNDLIKFNPFKKIKSLNVNNKFKKLNDIDDSVSTFNKDEILLILNNSKGNLYYFICIMLYSGIRPGEVISLTWNDIDFEKKQIAVDKTTVNGKVGNVKTPSSVRFVDIIPVLELELLKFYKSSLNTSSHVFISNRNKSYYSHDNFIVGFRKLLIKLNIKGKVLYNLRHTFASSMISQGINIVWVSRMLGHKDLSITLKVYTKFIKTNDDDRIKQLSKIVPDFVPI
ncbi:site-specific integrase [Aliarcobacter thereius]|uniref:Site-specific integrase n=1 Tax=Aliarcobacter thereius TaxID=544718 RepID=A0A5R9H7U1_9BACT|nr:site-specific integrase [Aliarcobacter thereius]TLS72150.1 site-specific integrase [Aliarcobacter thereius]